MAGAGVLLALVALVVTVGGGVLLYALVSAEHDKRATTDRTTAETMARRDSGDEDESGVEGNHWG